MTDDLCTTFGRPVVEDHDRDGKVLLHTHSERVYLSDDHALELANEIYRILGESGNTGKVGHE